MVMYSAEYEKSLIILKEHVTGKRQTVSSSLDKDCRLRVGWCYAMNYVTEYFAKLLLDFAYSNE